jgi:hypothetical protein
LAGTMRNQLLHDRVEEYVERSKERQRRLVRWTAIVVPFPLMFGPRLIEQMSLATRTGIIYTWGGLVALLGLGIVLSSWRFERAYAIRCSVCRVKITADPEQFRSVGGCPRCLDGVCEPPPNDRCS